ncbi:MAG TPA: CPBP family intramembrane glutamic endopeptidase [Gemmatimonadales bacterium]|nr:CPBP family intramembrane glutamic endopeptidase [Gemmatimonadales bacterium]
MLPAIGWSIAFLLLGFAFSFLLIGGLAYLLRRDVAAGLDAIQLSPALQALATGASLLGGFLAATWIVGRRALGLDARTLRWRVGHGARGAGWGLAVGIGAALLATGGAALVGAAHWSHDRGGFGDYLAQVTKTVAVLAPAALGEEVIFRGVPLVLLAGAIGRASAIVLVAGLAFAALHAINPGITPLALGNIALAGIWLGVAFYAPGGIWTAFGSHLGWNAALAALDAPVSGLPFEIPLLDYHAGVPCWLTGCRFGPEGGLLATGALILALLIAVQWARPGTAE